MNDSWNRLTSQFFIELDSDSMVDKNFLTIVLELDLVLRTTDLPKVESAEGDDLVGGIPAMNPLIMPLKFPCALANPCPSRWI